MSVEEPFLRSLRRSKPNSSSRRGGVVSVEEPFLRRLGLIRVLVAGYATGWTAARAPHLLDHLDFDARRFDPVGVLAPLAGPPAGIAVIAAVAATIAFGAAATLGWRYRLTGPALAMFFLAVTTYRNSWGQIFHTENLVALHLAVLAIAPADRHWTLSPRRRPGPGHRPAARRDGDDGRWAARDGRVPVPAAAARRDGDGGRWAVRALAVATVAGYVVAGVAKLRNGGAAWLDGEVLVNQVAFDNARKDVLGDVMSPLAGFFVENRWLARPAVWASMAVELGAPLALLGRRAAAAWSLAAWGFHLAILVLMAIVFPYHLLGLALIPLLPLEEWTQSARPPSRFLSKNRRYTAKICSENPGPRVL